MRLLPLTIIIVLTACIARAEDLPQGDNLAALVEAKCKQGCVVMNAEDLQALQRKLNELTKALSEAAREDGAKSCRMRYERTPQFWDSL